MALSVKHFFVSPKADGPDPTLVQPSAWNHEHVLNSDTNILLGRATAGVGAVEEIGLGSNFAFVGGNLTLVGNPKLVGNQGFGLPAGTSAQRDPAPTAGEIRFNSDTGFVEYWNGAAWTAGPDFSQNPTQNVNVAANWNLNAVAGGFGIAFGTAYVTNIALNDGQRRTLYTQDGYTVQYNATVITPGRVDLPVRPGDVVTYRGYPGSRVVVEQVLRADGQAVQEFASIELTLDGGGTALVNGTYVDFLVPFNFTGTQWTVLADRSGNIYLNLAYCTYAQFDGGSTHPVAGDAIVGSNYPCVQGATKGQNTLGGWSRTYFGGGDIVRAYVQSTDNNVQKLTLALSGWHV